jgi:hypothetical protein
VTSAAAGMRPKEEEEIVDAKEGLMVVVIVAVLVGRTGSALVFMEDLQLHYKTCYRFCVHVLGHIPTRSISVEFHVHLLLLPQM